MSGYQTQFVSAVKDYPGGSDVGITPIWGYQDTINSENRPMLSFIGSGDFMVPPLSTRLCP